jgi:hypothetical protein
MKTYKTLAFYPPYTVKIDQDGNLSCSCPVWIYHPVNRIRCCKHTIAAREEFADRIQAVKDRGLRAIESPLVPSI